MRPLGRRLLAGLLVLAPPACRSVELLASRRSPRALGGELGCAVPERLKRFSQKWDAYMEPEVKMAERLSKAAAASKGPPLAIVVGVMSRGGCADVPYRNVLRSTWMQLPEVCNATRAGPRAGCSVYVTFVLGNSSAPTGERDVATLPMRENMNCGKSPAWFRYAAKEYPWATHVAKMDMDAFLRVPRFLSIVRGFSHPCKNVFGGHSYISDRGDAWLPPEGCGHPKKADFLDYGDRSAECWSYMQGGFYMLTRELAANVSAPGGWWERESEQCKDEDAVAGHAVHKYAVEQKVCVAALKFPSGHKAFWHRP